jgi:uncharacterized protein (DUF362 family)
MKSTVAVIKTSPETVIGDIERAMTLAGVNKYLKKSLPTILKVNITWHFYYPACSTTPWQFDGVVTALKKYGYHNFIPAQNRTVVINPKLGAANNHLDSVMEKHKLNFVYLYDPDVEWVRYRPKAKMLVLDRVYKDGIQIPKMFIGKNAFHLPTMKTHVFTTITGAMKNAFGGLLNDNRHWTHSVIHEALVDLLQIQKEIHPGIFCVTDGTIAGSGAGPRLMEPAIKNYILASADSVAIDAVSAKMMGFDPLKLKFLYLAQEHGLGTADPQQIQIKGCDISDTNFHFQMKESLVSRGQKAIYWGKLKPFEYLLLRTPIVPWSFVASRAFHDFYWYNVHGRKIVRKYLATEWGQLFDAYK